MPDNFCIVRWHHALPHCRRCRATHCFIKAAFEAEELLLMRQSDGQVGHAEFRVNGGLLMLSQASAEYPAMPRMLHLYVPAVDSVFARTVAAGGKDSAPTSAATSASDLPRGE